MNFILTPFGSGGDVYPFIWMGKVLRDRGHSVALIAPEAFRIPVEKAGLRFAPIGKEEEYYQVLTDADLWDSFKGPGIIFEYAGRAIRLYFDAIRSLNPAGDTVLVGSSLALGTRLFREKFGLRMVTVHLQPSTFLSAIDMPVLANGMDWFCRLPLFFRKLFYRLPNPMDTRMAPYLTFACREEGIVPPQRILNEWWHSPDGVIGLFPDWYAQPQADWPANTRLFGFPLYDLRDQWEFPPELTAFLKAGEKPVLFTPGTGMAHGHSFFETALEACCITGMRALIVTKHPEHLPARLPRTVLHCSYLPFSRILPHCAVLVSHGGIGTLSQGLAAGIPQILMPMAYDQPDNLNRIRRLNAGDGLSPRDFTPDRLAGMLRKLVRDPGIQKSCQSHAQKLQQEHHEPALVKYLEG